MARDGLGDPRSIRGCNGANFHALFTLAPAGWAILLVSIAAAAAGSKGIAGMQSYSGLFAAAGLVSGAIAVLTNTLVVHWAAKTRLLNAADSSRLHVTLRFGVGFAECRRAILRRRN